MRPLNGVYSYTEQELANLAELAKIAFQRVENTKFSVTLGVLISLTRVLNLSLKELTDFIIPKGKAK